MTLKIKGYRCLCSLAEFEINGIPADYDEFGEKYDHNPGEAEPYACADMRFDRRPAASEVLKKYSITEREYEEICDKLTELLSFGCCGWCV